MFTVAQIDGHRVPAENLIFCNNKVLFECARDNFREQQIRANCLAELMIRCFLRKNDKTLAEGINSILQHHELTSFLKHDDQNVFELSSIFKQIDPWPDNDDCLSIACRASLRNRLQKLSEVDGFIPVVYQGNGYIIPFFLDEKKDNRCIYDCKGALIDGWNDCISQMCLKYSVRLLCSCKNLPALLVGNSLMLPILCACKRKDGILTYDPFRRFFTGKIENNELQPVDKIEYKAKAIENYYSAKAYLFAPESASTNETKECKNVEYIGPINDRYLQKRLEEVDNHVPSPRRNPNSRRLIKNYTERCNEDKIISPDILYYLKQVVSTGNIPDAKFHWGMHDIGFIDKLPKKQGNGFYPDPDFIVTPHSLKLSWLMENITKTWYASEGSKQVGRYDFFIPILDHIKKYVERNPMASDIMVCSMLLEAADERVRTYISEATCSGDELKGMVYYFAYGGDINSERMQTRDPKATDCGRAILRNYKIRERLYADIDYVEGEKLEGVLYAIEQTALRELDSRNGCQHNIYKRLEVDVEINGCKYPAVTYKLNNKAKNIRDGIPYPESYRIQCSEGAKQHNLKDYFAL